MMRHRRRGPRRRGLPQSGRRGRAAGPSAVGGAVGARSARLPRRGRAAATTTLSLVATDGYVTIPPGPNRLYVFGFVPVRPSLTVTQLIGTYKGTPSTLPRRWTSSRNDDIKITLTNLGLVQRPDLTDSHTVHWHGFDVPSPLNDGVPEVSVAVPIGKSVDVLLPAAPSRARTCTTATSRTSSTSRWA